MILRRPLLLTLAGVPLVVAAAVAVPALTLPVVGLVVLGAAAPLLRALTRGAAWSVPVLAGIAVLLTDTGGRSIAPGPARYLASAVVVLTIVLIGVDRDQRSRAVRTTALVLFGYGLVGTLYGRFVLGTANGTLPLIGPMVIACLPPLRNWSAPDWRLGLRMIAAAGTLFAVGSGLSRLGVLPATQIDVLNHEKAFLVVMAVAAAVAARDVLLVVASLAAAIFAFSAYPAATYVVAAVVCLGTVLLARRPPAIRTRVVLAAGVMIGSVVAVLHVDQLIALTNSYFQLVGKVDNGDTREALYRAALDRLDHPVFSSFFTGDITVVGDLSGTNRVVPVHNDYLSITLGGGFVGAALLLGLFLFANGLALRTVRSAADPWQRRTVIVLLGAVNGAAVSAFANPIFMNPGASALAFALISALVAACRLPPHDVAPAATATATASASRRDHEGWAAQAPEFQPDSQIGASPTVRWGAARAERRASRV